MAFLSKLFSKASNSDSQPRVDMHSHLIPGIDDGSESIEESIELIKRMVDLGYQKIITTPHIMGDFYKNTPEIISEGLETVRGALKKENVEVVIEAAAEYYLDEWFVEKLDRKDELLTFGGNYLLVETSYLNRPSNLFDIIFKIQSAGYKVVLAHPERYTYMYDDFSAYEKLYSKNIYFQLNLNSLSGYYSPMAKKISEKLIDKRMIQFIGTDCHGDRHLDCLESKTRKSKYYSRLLKLPLLNDSV